MVNGVLKRYKPKGAKRKEQHFEYRRSMEDWNWLSRPKRTKFYADTGERWSLKRLMNWWHKIPVKVERKPWKIGCKCVCNAYSTKSNECCLAPSRNVEIYSLERLRLEILTSLVIHKTEAKININYWKLRARQFSSLFCFAHGMKIC